MRSAFIIGGTGQIGIATAAELMRHGWRVTVAHTGRREAQNVPPGAEIVAVDRRDSAALAAAIGTTDLLVDTMAFTAADADQLVDLAGHCGQLSVISTASVYADEQGRGFDTAGTTGFPEYPVPVRETQPRVPPSADSYSTNKVALEDRLLEASTKPVTILRPCAIHGINSKHPREWWLLKRMLDGRRVIPLAGGSSAVFHTSATANIAALIRAAAEQPATRVLNAADPVAPSLREIGETLAAMVGWNGTLVDMPVVSEVGGTPFSVPHPVVVSMEAAEAIGYVPAGTYAETLVPYVAWMRAHEADWKTAFPVFTHYPSDPFDYAAEDAAL